MRGLYPIIDVASASKMKVDLLQLAELALSIRPACLQLRAKSTSPRDTLALLRELRPRCRQAGTLLFANDRPDLAALAGADGVHLGQEDVPIELVRRQFSTLKVGLSTHTLAQLETALVADPDYVALGPIFPTTSKDNPDQLVGVSGLRRARALVTSCSLVAIGGITRERAAQVAPYADMGAVIGALGSSLAGGTSGVLALHLALGGQEAA